MTSQLFKKLLRPIGILVMISMLPSCASPQDQFGYAVMKGNTEGARQFIAPRYARMQITESNGQQSVPIQYAIVQNNKEMASFLLQNDCHKSIGGDNLAYYSARSGYSDMARFFASKGEGSYSDIERAKRDQARSNSNAAVGGLIALVVLASLLGGSSGGGGDLCTNCGSAPASSGHRVCSSCNLTIMGAAGVVP